MKLDPRLRLFVFPCVLLLLLSACGQGGDDSAGGGESAPQKRFLSIGTAPTGGAFFVVGGALAEVADQFGQELGWTVTAEATAGSQENIRRLVDGDLDFALSNAAITYFAVRGEASWDRPYDLRNVMTLAPNIALFVTPAGSGVETIADLAGKRVVIGPAGAGFEMFVGPILAAHGVDYDDFTELNAPQSGAVDLLSDGNADAAVADRREVPVHEHPSDRRHQQRAAPAVRHQHRSETQDPTLQLTTPLPSPGRKLLLAPQGRSAVISLPVVARRSPMVA